MERALEEESVNWVIFVKKAILFALLFGLLQGMLSHFPHIGFAIGVMTGAVVQHFLPPRGQRLWIVISLASVAAAVRFCFP